VLDGETLKKIGWLIGVIVMHDLISTTYDERLKQEDVTDTARRM